MSGQPLGGHDYAIYRIALARARGLTRELVSEQRGLFAIEEYVSGFDSGKSCWGIVFFSSLDKPPRTTDYGFPTKELAHAALDQILKDAAR